MCCFLPPWQGVTDQGCGRRVGDVGKVTGFLSCSTKLPLYFLKTPKTFFFESANSVRARRNKRVFFYWR